MLKKFQMSSKFLRSVFAHTPKPYMPPVPGDTISLFLCIGSYYLVLSATQLQHLAPYFTILFFTTLTRLLPSCLLPTSSYISLVCYLISFFLFPLFMITFPPSDKPEKQHPYTFLAISSLHYPLNFAISCL